MPSLTRVHLLHPPDDESLARLKRALDPAVRLSLGPETPPGADYQILVAGRPGRAVLEASPDLQALVIPWAGLPPETHALLREFAQISVFNLHHNAAAVAEMAIALLLAAAKFLVSHDQALRRGDWTPRYGPKRGLNLAGKTALVLGYGAIGQRVAAILRGLGMRVTAIRRFPEKTQAGTVDEIYPPGALQQRLRAAQALLICLPLTEETEGMIGPDELAALRPEAVLVNIGRAAVVDEEALYQALASGQLHAAGLDVWYNYPQDEASRANTPPSAYPFEELDNVVLSPHLSGMPGKAEIESLRMAALAETLNAAARGERIPNPVDRTLGY